MGDYALDDIHEGILYQYANISRLFHTHALMSLTSYSECSFPCCSNSNWSYKDAVFVPSAVDLADSTLILTRSIALLLLLQSGSHPSWYVHSILISLRISVRSLNIVKSKNSAFLLPFFKGTRSIYHRHPRATSHMLNTETTKLSVFGRCFHGHSGPVNRL